MAKIRTHYDKKRDVFYVKRGKRGTRNVALTPNEDICLNPDTYEIIGYIITNFSEVYPKLVKRYTPAEAWFVKEFFDQRLHDWNVLLEPLRSLKARVDFLSKERTAQSVVPTGR